jgi:hypothetical protein
MPFLAGDIITAQKLNWLSPTILGAAASTTLTGITTNADIPGMSIPITTVNAGALLKVSWFVSFYTQGGSLTAAISSSRILVDTTPSTVVNIFSPGNSGIADKNQGASSWVTTLAAAGAHTIKAQATLPSTGVLTQIHSSMDIEVIEAF